jgi:hypothetical protein
LHAVSGPTASAPRAAPEVAIPRHVKRFPPVSVPPEDPPPLDPPDHRVVQGSRGIQPRSSRNDRDPPGFLSVNSIQIQMSPITLTGTVEESGRSLKDQPKVKLLPMTPGQTIE